MEMKLGLLSLVSEECGNVNPNRFLLLSPWAYSCLVPREVACTGSPALPIDSLFSKSEEKEHVNVKKNPAVFQADFRPVTHHLLPTIRHRCKDAISGRPWDPQSIRESGQTGAAEESQAQLLHFHLATRVSFLPSLRPSLLSSPPDSGAF